MSPGAERRPGLHRGLAVALAGLLVAGCAQDGADHPRGDERDDRVATTARALAVVAAEHAGEPASGSPSTDDGLETGAELRYRPSEGDDGDLLRVGLMSEEAAADLPTCSAEPDLPCARVDATTTLFWELAVPEEDPGYVAVLRRDDRGVVLVLAAGEAITGDPRDLDLTLEVTTLEQIAADTRVGRTTTAGTVAAAADLAWWTD